MKYDADLREVSHIGPEDIIDVIFKPEKMEFDEDEDGYLTPSMSTVRFAADCIGGMLDANRNILTFDIEEVMKHYGVDRLEALRIMARSHIRAPLFNECNDTPRIEPEFIRVDVDYTDNMVILVLHYAPVSERIDVHELDLFDDVVSNYCLREWRKYIDFDEYFLESYDVYHDGDAEDYALSMYER